jgi:Ca-activated chloride channel family protein
MKPAAAAAGPLPAGLVLTALLLAACSTSSPPQNEIAADKTGSAQATSARMAAPMAPPAPPAPNPITVTGSAAYRNAPAPMTFMPPPAYLPPGIGIVLPRNTDKFPDKEANKPVLVSEQPVSTFSADVDTASYAFVRRMLASGRLPAPDAVRVEEMVNYFPYHYAGPRSADQPFAVQTEVLPNPWKAGSRLLHIAVRGYDIKTASRPRANVVLLVDVSGSMMPADRLPLLKQGFRLFAQQLRDDDTLAIVSYASGTRVVLEPTPGKDKGKILDAIDGLRAGGGTAGGEGLQRAYDMAQRNFDPKAVNRVILATDGDFNLGITDPKQLERFIADKRRSGVYLSIFGVGEGNLNDALMQRLAQSGNGNAAYIDSLLEARKALGEELGSTMFPIANDVKIQVEFNPDQVAAYRLVGYETRMLQRQDFKDDKVDAGDMGAGHTVTAIYEIVPAADADKLADPLRYGRKEAKKKAAGKHGDELCFVKLRYKLPGQSTSREIAHAVQAGAAHRSLDKAPADQRFAIAVAAFGQRLRGEPQLADFGYDRIAELANGARGDDPEGYRAEFVKLVRMAETLGQTGAGGQP